MRGYFFVALEAVQWTNFAADMYPSKTMSGR